MLIHFQNLLIFAKATFMEGIALKDTLYIFDACSWTGIRVELQPFVFLPACINPSKLVLTSLFNKLFFLATEAWWKSLFCSVAFMTTKSVTTDISLYFNKLISKFQCILYTIYWAFFEFESKVSSCKMFSTVNIIHLLLIVYFSLACFSSSVAHSYFATKWWAQSITILC